MSAGRRRSAMGPGPGVAIALVLLVPALSWAQTMYKWVDEKGVTHFSESPPPDDRKATKVTPRVTPPSSPGASSSDNWKAKDAEFKQRQVERSQKDKADEKTAARNAQLCDQWRSRAAFLADGRIYRDNPDGTRSWMDESQRAAEIAKAKENAAQYCR